MPSFSSRPEEPSVTGNDFLLFSLDEARYAVRLPAVERVVRAVEVTPLPGAPEIVLGIVNVGGRIIPVADVRKRFGLPERPVDPADQFIIARTPARTVALAVDATHGVATIPEASVAQAGSIVAGLGYLSGVAKLPEGLVLIHDLGSFLSLPEEQALEEALRAREPGA